MTNPEYVDAMDIVRFHSNAIKCLALFWLINLACGCPGFTGNIAELGLTQEKKADRTFKIALDSYIAAQKKPLKNIELKFEFDLDLKFVDTMESFRNDVTKVTKQIYSCISPGLGIELTTPLNLRIISRNTFKEMIDSKEFAYIEGAFYIRNNDTHAILIQEEERLFATTKLLLVHELVHALFDHNGQGCRLPRWLNEGSARLFERKFQKKENPTIDEINTLEQLIVKNNIPATEKKLSAYDYLHSYGVVWFLQNQYGQKSYINLIHGLLSDKDTNAVFKRIYQKSIQDLMEEFKIYVKDELNHRVQQTIRSKKSGD
jgi:hypothetical protein